MNESTAVTFSALVLLSAVSFAPPVSADQALAQAKGCMACHQVANKVVGPALKDIAAKYKGDSTAVATLAGKVRSGGVGTWGQIPMPPQTLPTDEELNTIVAWMLSL